MPGAEEDTSPRERHGGLRFSSELNAGHLLQAGMMVVLVVSYFITQAGKSDQTAANLAAARSEFSSAISRIEQSQAAAISRVEQGQAAVLQQIRQLPDLGARTTQVERRIDNAEARMGGMEERLARNSDAISEVRAELSALQRGLNGPLLPSPTPQPRRPR